VSGDSLIPFARAEPALAAGPLPSPSAVLLDVTLEFAERTQNRNLQQKAYAALKMDSAAMEDTPYFYASHITVLARHMDN
ncbi:MAG: hypothetical protein DRQ37_04245, partial [Gammaproteobacteria bacterium]